jgi:hypothetical protein
LLLGIACVATVAALVALQPGTPPQPPSRAPVVPASTCVSAANKLAGIWDPATRARIGSRFELDGKPFVLSVWRGHAAQFDQLTQQWSTLWDRACAADDQVSDPLLHGQRLACLEANLLEVRAFSSALGNPAIDVEAFARGSPGQFPLTPPLACAQEAFLRGQVPLPPFTSRPEIDAVMAEFHYQRSQARLATTGAVHIDLWRMFDKLTELEQRSRALGYTAGTEEILFWHGVFLLWFGRLDDAHVIASRIIELAEQTRDDSHLVLGLVLDVDTNVRRPAPYDDAASEAALTRATKAAERLDRPTHLLEWIEEARVEHLARMHRPGIESRLRLVALRTELNATSYALWARTDLAKVQAWNGQPATALVEARAILREREQLQGPWSLLLADDRVELSMVFALAGDVPGALEQAERAIAIYTPAWGTRPSTELWRARMQAAGYAAQLGKRDVAERHLRAAIDASVADGSSRTDAFSHAVQTLRQLGHRRAAELALEIAGRSSIDLATERRELAREVTEQPASTVTTLDPALRWNAPQRGDHEARLGIALAATGNQDAALHLEDAIWIYASCCDANAVIVQDARLALADLHWRTGNRQSARQLATLARDRLATMGLALAGKLHAAQRWLALHP